MEVVGIIMASGFSKRLGRNKLLLNLDSTTKTLIEKTVETIKKSTIDKIIIVYREDKILSKIDKFNILKIKNEKAEIGQSESIKLALKSCSNKYTGYMFFVGDQYFLNKETIDVMIDKFKENHNSIIIPRGTKEIGNPIIFPYKFREKLLDLEGDVGGRKVINFKKDNIKFINVEDKELWDIDTEEDIQKIKRELKL